MSIRGRLLALAIGGVLPLLIVGLTVLGIVWSQKQNQLNDGLEQQAELDAAALSNCTGRCGMTADAINRNKD